MCVVWLETVLNLPISPCVQVGVRPKDSPGDRTLLKFVPAWTKGRDVIGVVEVLDRFSYLDYHFGGFCLGISFCISFLFFKFKVMGFVLEGFNKHFKQLMLKYTQEVLMVLSNQWDQI